MLLAKAREIETLDTIEAVWRATVAALGAEGVTTVLYLSSDAARTDVRMLTTTPAIHDGHAPATDPFLEHCCASYEITRTGAAFLQEHDYLPEAARAFIRAARDHGFSSGLGIPMRLVGSPRFGGFNLGTPLDRACFEAAILPRREEFRLLCLIAHRRLEELGFPAPEPAATPGFRDLLVAPEMARLDGLSPREREVIWLQAQGLPRKEVARLCGISPHTVAEYASNAYRKLGVRNRTEAARIVFGA
ncbi:helix-turn-helix transcriptional regulator [Jannaschia ovalis]|uniref:LuxR C-terminal-related transcriptional regulator n=1 Tax=Jannaschia ovalis TaxID=3038773 RepID=A0ABY8LAS6_9RHOB|nr:LuxR family transcriptional regulator [Jannaschia sp. GRR-S6-38]WGH78241.1 LuxR C-terminal-related transcriptional regulator [Jannaschia sp. GRR-S6-38]